MKPIKTKAGQDVFKPKRVLRAVLLISTLWLFFSGLIHQCHAKGNPPFGFQDVIQKANDLSKKPFITGQGNVPKFLLEMGYDNWRNIRFKPKHALWGEDNLLFTAQFFHPGLYYDRTVQINSIDSTGVHPVTFSRDLFDYGTNNFQDRVPENLGFAGFRLHYPINKPDYYDEVAVFLGATYFRVLAKRQNFGISARGLAINTALPGGEEFPYFKEFWLVKPKPNEGQITIYALLDSPSATGAYKYIIYPWKETLIRVVSRLFARRDVEKLGIAPLTSMFFYGENTNQRPVDDFRPEVHDSDGLLICTASGEWIWRPLRNPRSLLATSFQLNSPMGFGLIQRDTHFGHYQDLEANYQTRPSVWISPVGNWGDGRIELIQIPLVENEVNDNVVAFWVPSRLPDSGQPISFSYEMSWHFPGHKRPPGGRVIATRTAKGKEKNVKKFIIDFAGGRLQSLSADDPLTAVISVDKKADLIEQQLYRNRITNGFRLVFQIRLQQPGSLDRLLPDDKKTPIELRAFLKLNENALTETWSYAYAP
jgi:periplasmic glucans biosynthesis protein